MLRARGGKPLYVGDGREGDLKKRPGSQQGSRGRTASVLSRGTKG